MGIFLGFAPFLGFALATSLWGPTIGLAAGAVTSAALVMREFIRKRQPKILEVGTLVMFAGLLAWNMLFPSLQSILSVRLRVDLGLLLIIVISMAIGKPFTLQYARDRVPAERWNSPKFVRINFVITAIWALAFVIIAAADLIMLYMPDVPIRVGIVVTVAALYGAYRFTTWYPTHAVQPDRN